MILQGQRPQEAGNLPESLPGSGQLRQSASTLRDKTPDGRVCLPGSALPEFRVHPVAASGPLLVAVVRRLISFDPLRLSHLCQRMGGSYSAQFVGSPGTQ